MRTTTTTTTGRTREIVVVALLLLILFPLRNVGLLVFCVFCRRSSRSAFTLDNRELMKAKNIYNASVTPSFQKRCQHTNDAHELCVARRDAIPPSIPAPLSIPQQPLRLVRMASLGEALRRLMQGVPPRHHNARAPPANSYYERGNGRWICMPCSQLLDAGGHSLLCRYDSREVQVLEGGQTVAACRCVFLGMDGRPLLLKRLCFPGRPAGRVDGHILRPRAEDVVFRIEDMSRKGTMVLENVKTRQCHIYLHADIISIGAFLPLRPGIRRYRLTVRCRKAVYLAHFLQCRDVMHARACSRSLRASVDPNAIDFDWCKLLVKKT